MKCKEENIIDYMEGDSLTPSEKKAVEAHLTDCVDCLDLAARMRGGMMGISEAVLSGTPDDANLDVKPTGKETREADEGWKAFWPRIKKGLYSFTPPPGQDLVSLVVELKKELKEQGDSPVLLYRLAKILEIQDSVEEALCYMEKAALSDPENPDLAAQTGCLFARTSDWEKAKKWALTAIGIDSTHTGGNGLLGHCLYNDGRHGAAESKWEEVLRLDEKNESAAMGLALISTRDAPTGPEHFSSTLSRVKRLSETYAQNPYLRNYLGDVYLCSRDRKMAVAAFKEADKLTEKRSHKGPIPVARKENKKTHPREEKIALEESLLKDPSNVQKRVALGRVYAEMGRYEETIFHWEIAAKSENEITDLLFWYNLGRIYLSKGEDEKAEDCFQKMLALDPEGKEKLKDEALHGLGKVLLRRGEVENAIEKIREAIRLDPLTSEYRVELGEALFQKEEIEEAEDELEKAIEGDPDDPRALLLLARASIRKEDDLTALKYVEKLVALQPKDHRHMRMLARIYGRLGLLFKKEEAEQRAAEFEPRVGIANAIAFLSPTGRGFISEVECSAREGEQDLQVTGNIGKVLEDTVEVVEEYLAGHWKEINLKPLYSLDIFINFSDPERFTDGPSAALPILVAIVSAVKNIPISPLDVFTGGLSIHGEIQSIGNIREKIEAAAVVGMDRFFFPEENLKDIPARERAALERKIQLVPVKTTQELISAIKTSE